MPPLSLPVDLQCEEIIEKLESIQEELEDLEDLITGLNNEKEEYEMWISKNNYSMGQLLPDSFVYRQLQRRTNKWNVQIIATDEMIHDLRKKQDELHKEEQELKDDLSHFSQDN